MKIILDRPQASIATNHHAGSSVQSTDTDHPKGRLVRQELRSMYAVAPANSYGSSKKAGTKITATK
jgi:hypothetical protein